MTVLFTGPYETMWLKPGNWATLLVAVLLFAQGCGENTGIATGPAPDFNLELFSGGKFRLTDHKGTPVVINFFASWCRACGEETPVIEKAAHEYGPGKVAFLAIAVDDTEKKAKQFMRKKHLD